MIGREREKKNLSPEFRSYSTRARKFRKKIPKELKNLFPALFLSKTGYNRPRKIKKKKKKKKFSPHSVHTRPEQENSKKNCKKNHKIKKHTSDIISSQNGMR